MSPLGLIFLLSALWRRFAALAHFLRRTNDYAKFLFETPYSENITKTDKQGKGKMHKNQEATFRDIRILW